MLLLLLPCICVSVQMRDAMRCDAMRGRGTDVVRGSHAVLHGVVLSVVVVAELSSSSSLWLYSGDAGASDDVGRAAVGNSSLCVDDDDAHEGDDDDSVCFELMI